MNITDGLKHEKALFLSSFINSPKQMGSMIPSSRFLCKRMIQSIPWKEIHSIAELGSGTGAITKYIQAAAANQTKVLLFEKETVLQQLLRLQFPSFACYTDARQLLAAVRTEKIEALDCIVSGLPFFNFAPELRELLLKQIIASLKPNGLFVAFQYSLQMKKMLDQHFDIEQIHFVPLNFPPAFVYVCRKKGETV